MNERIKQLAEQCQIETYAVNGELIEIGFDAEKFAELIVRECMDVCYRTDTEYEGHKVKSTVIASKVAEHFGVEE
jgi:hypothetical protein